MTHDRSALLAQLDALASADSGAIFDERMRASLQALIEAEAAEKIGAGCYQRTADRSTYRNGRRSKTVSTTSGDVSVKIPKLRSWSFFPSPLEKRRRVDQALHSVIRRLMSMASRPATSMIWCERSESILGSPNPKLPGSAAVSMSRSPHSGNARSHTPNSRTTVCDATFCKVRVGAHAVSQALVVVTGVSASGTREVLGQPWVTVNRSSSGASSWPPSRRAAWPG